MERVEIKLRENPYDILIGPGLLNNLDNLIEDNTEQNFIITDENVHSLYADYLKPLTNYDTIVIPPGEESKSIDMATNILKTLLKKGTSRKSQIIAFGGGVVGDLAGFCSSIYMRGISFVQVPTTLLAQVDSSVGGKTGVNLMDYKNSVGAFYQPKRVIIDTKVLHTLPYRQVLSGIGEIIKYGIIYDYDFFQYVIKHIDQIKCCNPDIMSYVIKTCCEIKAKIVAQDEKENGLRKILNFGHTIGHGLEGITGFSKYTHGEAVIIGMYYETFLAKKLGLINKNYSKEIMDFIEDIGLDLNIDDYPISQLTNWMLKDKKNVKGKISFIFPIAEGRVEEHFLTKDELIDINLK
ncbi:MAG: 3-dehydroquinate synthase [Clostridiales bacterium]|nr:3-dehydroquinate synthase [Clostridiales bacterium]